MRTHVCHTNVIRKMLSVNIQSFHFIYVKVVFHLPAIDGGINNAFDSLAYLYADIPGVPGAVCNINKPYSQDTIKTFR